jgi:hypothetical protein
MQISKVLSGVAVCDLEQARRWYQTLFDRPADLFATVTDPDGNAITVVEVRQGVTL